MIVWTNLLVETDHDGGGWVHSAYVPGRSETAKLDVLVALVCGYDATTTRGETHRFTCRPCRPSMGH